MRPFRKEETEACKKIILEQARLFKDQTLCIDLWYPNLDGHVKTIQIGLIDVRAADDIQVSYDKARDGWVIKQASVFEFDCEDKVCDPDWQEVAFIQAWGRDKSEV